MSTGQFMEMSANVPVGISDALGVTDSLTAVRALATVTNDAVAGSDSATSTEDYRPGTNDSGGISDAVQASSARQTSQDDVAGLTDGSTLSRSIPTADTVAVMDTVTADLAGTNSATISDASALVDSMETMFASQRSAADGLPVTDSLDVRTGRTAQDVSSLNDTMSLSRVTYVSDTVGLVDSVAADFAGSGNTSFGDSAGGTDTTRLDQAKPLGDAESLSDGVSYSIGSSSTVIDSAGLTDTLGATMGLSQPAYDVAGASDAIDLTQTRFSLVTDPVTLTDQPVVDLVRGSLSRGQMLELQANSTYRVSDTVGVTDSVDSVLTAESSRGQLLEVAATQVPLTPTRGQLLAVQVSAPLAITVNDSLRISDVDQDQYVGVGFEVFDNLSITDSIVKAITLASPGMVADGLRISDATAQLVHIVRSLNESVGLADNAAGLVSADGGTQDNSTLSDVVNVIQNMGRSASDQLSLTDFLSAVKVAVVALVENSTLTDVTSVARPLPGYADSAAATDQVTAVATSVRSAADQASILDSVRLDLSTHNPALRSDYVTVTDTVVALLRTAQEVSETVGVKDNITVSFARGARDTVPAFDIVYSSLAMPRNATPDELSIGDTVMVNFIAGARSAGVVDALTMSDAITAKLANVTVQNDSVILSDRTAVQRIKPLADSVKLLDRVVVQKSTSRSVVVADTIQATDRAARVRSLHKYWDGRTWVQVARYVWTGSRWSNR